MEIFYLIPIIVFIGVICAIVFYCYVQSRKTNKKKKTKTKISLDDAILNRKNKTYMKEVIRIRDDFIRNTKKEIADNLTNHNCEFLLCCNISSALNKLRYGDLIAEDRHSLPTHTVCTHGFTREVYAAIKEYLEKLCADYDNFEYVENGQINVSKGIQNGVNLCIRYKED